jgi:hypothetical protein
MGKEEEDFKTMHGRSRSSSVLRAINDQRLTSSLHYLDQSPSSGRIRFERNVKRYFYQLQKGCSTNCNFKLCASNQNVTLFTKEVAAVLAVQLASNNTDMFCPNIPADPDIVFNAFSLSQFSTPLNSPMHSRQNSVKSMTEPQKPFLHSLFNSPSFSSIFNGSNGKRIRSYSDSIRSTSQLNLTKQLDLSFSKLDSEVSSTWSSKSSIDSLNEPAEKDNDLCLKVMDSDLLRIAIETCTTDNMNQDLTFLLNSIYYVFSDPEALAQSFLKKNTKEIDIESLLKSYEILNNQEVLKKLAEATKKILSRLHQLIKNQIQPDIMRIIVILLLSPIKNNDTTMNICKIYEKIRSKDRQYFIDIFQTLPTIVFKSLLVHIQEYFLKFTFPVQEIQPAFLGCIKLLSTLSHCDKLPLSEFYLPEIYPKLQFKDEFRKWKKSLENPKVSEFSIFNYPFLFDPISKTRIIHIDALVKMSKQYEQACVSQALVLHATKFLDSKDSIKEFEKLLKEESNPYLMLEIRRGFMIEDLITQLQRKHSQLRKPLKIKFVNGGEEGMDVL